MAALGLAEIRTARERLRGVARITPLYGSETLSRLAGRPVHLKAENLQRTGSFKVRGAVNTLAALGEADPVAEQGAARERAGRVDGDDAGSPPEVADVAKERRDQARLPDAGRAGDADRVCVPGLRIEVVDEVVRERVGALDEGDRTRQRTPVAVAHAGSKRLPRPLAPPGH